MANYRQIHTQIWKDDWFIELSTPEKILFIYLFSNDNSNLIGLYKISKRVITNETGLSQDTVTQALAKFEADKKVVYRDGIIWIVHMWRYHNNASPLVQTRVKRDRDLIPDLPIKHWYQYFEETGIFNIDEQPIPYQYPIDTNSYNLKQSNLNSSELIQSNPDEGEIIKKFMDNVCFVTPLIAEKIHDDFVEFGKDWCVDAITETAKGHGKSYNYFHKVLENRKNGYSPGKNGKSSQPSGKSVAQEVAEELENARKQDTHRQRN